MEFTIDVEAVRRIAREESEFAQRDIACCGPERAFALSQQRHDARLAAAAAGTQLACSAGCSWCCHFRVDARSTEIMGIIEYIGSALSPQMREQCVSAIRERAAVINQLTEEEHLKRNIACAFLDAGRCMIYPVRPQTCRNYHATDSAGCQHTFEHPEDEDIDPDYAPAVYQAGGVHVDCVSRAMKEAGVDVCVHEMHTALAEVLSNPDRARARFSQGLPPWTSSRGFEPACEFLDLLE